MELNANLVKDELSKKERELKTSIQQGLWYLKKAVDPILHHDANHWSYLPPLQSPHLPSTPIEPRKVEASISSKCHQWGNDIYKFQQKSTLPFFSVTNCNKLIK